jgi:hypothetical protein
MNGACHRPTEETAEALASVEPDVLRALHDASAAFVPTEGESEEECRLRAWRLYEVAIDLARTSLAAALRDHAFQALHTHHALAPVLTAAVDDAYESDRYFVGARAEYSPIALSHARKLLASHVESTAIVCANEAVDRLRGRWVAIFRGKL